MPDIPELPDSLRERLRHRPAAVGGDWFRIQAKDEPGKPKTAEVWIYDRIGSDWFDEGVSAKSFARQLKALDVDEIILHLNTPGGDAWDGIAIYNSLKDHRARVTVVVDALAASAGSYIAQSGDVVRMNRAATMMIHDASGVAMGNAKDMADFADVLDKLSNSVAGIYASRAGGEVADWRAAMGRETWYTAAEAVEAGLADETVDEQPAEPKARARFDLKVFAYAGRDKAPPPRPAANVGGMPTPHGPTPPGPTSAGRSTNPQKGAGMDPARLAKLREAYDLPADAPEADVLAKMAADVPAPAPATQPPPESGGGGARDDALPPKVTAPSAGSDAVLMDPAHLRQLQAQAARGDEAFRKMREAECDTVISQAIKDGKFPPSREEHYRLRWATDPDGTEDEIKRLAKNTIPVSASGYTGVGDETETDMVYNAMYPNSSKAGASRG